VGILSGSGSPGSVSGTGATAVAYGAGGYGQSNVGGGAVRIIWGALSRAFPSTSTGDL
jgi:hypothetical protein